MALAIIPGLLIIIYVYKKDKVEKEPIGLIIKLIIFGAVSCIAAGILESIEASFLPEYPKGSLGYALINAFAMAALVEEIVKYLALRIGSWKYSGFNYRFDGIVYGVSAAVGFALYENVAYVAMYGLSTAIVRAFTAVPLHSFCGVFMGIFYSYEKKASILGQGSESFKFRILALIVPMLIHGVYDTLAFLQTETSSMLLLVFVVILYIISIRAIKKLSKADYAAGFYPEARTIEYDMDL
jgi:RsiW-degrading membrane proteinase PrsW (M82 family)